MTSWQTLAHTDPVPWLLEEGAPWVRYRTLIDLLDRPAGDPDVIAARQAMLVHPLVQDTITAAASWPGYALKRHNDAKHPLHALSLLADWGLRADDPGMGAVVEAVLAHQSEDGAFQTQMLMPERFGGTGEPGMVWMLCDAPLLVYVLARFGLADHPQVARAVEHLQSYCRDYGWPCAASISEKFRGPGRATDPCPYANLLALRALAEFPALADDATLAAGAEALLGHWERQREPKLFMFGIGTDFRKLKYPFIWYDVLHMTETLSRVPAARRDPRLREMADVVLSKQDEAGRFKAESVWMAWKTWDFGQKRAPSPTLTLAAWRILRRVYA